MVVKFLRKFPVTNFVKYFTVEVIKAELNLLYLFFFVKQFGKSYQLFVGVGSHKIGFNGIHVK